MPSCSSSKSRSPAQAAGLRCIPPGPLLRRGQRLIDDTWSVHVGTPGSTVSVGKSGTRNAAASSALLLVDGAGTPVGMSMSGELGVDNAWKGSPTAWEFISEADMTAHLDAPLEREASRGLLRVASVASAAGRAAGPRSLRGLRRPSTSHDAMTEWNGTGILVDNRAAVVIANFKPTLTARLNDIKVYADQFESAATFGNACGLRRVPRHARKARFRAIRFDSAPITSRKGELLLKAEVAVLGETRTAYYWREPSARSPWLAPAGQSDHGLRRTWRPVPLHDGRCARRRLHRKTSEGRGAGPGKLGLPRRLQHARRRLSLRGNQGREGPTSIPRTARSPKTTKTASLGSASSSNRWTPISRTSITSSTRPRAARAAQW